LGFAVAPAAPGHSDGCVPGIFGQFDHVQNVVGLFQRESFVDKSTYDLEATKVVRE
jgi:hypothetical protein